MEVDAPVDAPVDDEVEMEVEPIDKEVGGPIEGFWSYAALGAYLLKLSQLTDEEVKAKLRNVTVMVLVRQYCTAYESQLLTQQNRDDTFDEAYERVKSLLPKSAASVVNAFATRAASVAVDQINGSNKFGSLGCIRKFRDVRKRGKANAIANAASRRSN